MDNSTIECSFKETHTTIKTEESHNTEEENGLFKIFCKNESIANKIHHEETLAVKNEIMDEDFVKEEPHFLIDKGKEGELDYEDSRNATPNNRRLIYRRCRAAVPPELSCQVYCEPMEKKVKYLQNVNFHRLTMNEKLAVKDKGRPMPYLNIQQSSTSRSKDYIRQFNSNIYLKCDWICGCDETNSLFCFPCLLFGGDESWTKTGIRDLRHLPQKIKKHEQSSKHMNNMIDLSLLGRVNIAIQIDSAYKLSLAKHNELVRKNRDVLSKIINCIKFCGKFELPIRGHAETESSKNPGVFLSLLDFASELDSNLHAHFNTATIFKETSKTIQNELLESILTVCQERIKEEVSKAEYLAVMYDETTDVYDKTQIIIVLRYELQGAPVERFWGFFNPPSLTADVIARLLQKELNNLIQNCPDKLIAQTYGGAAALSGDKTGVHAQIKETFKNAHFVHCYAHQLNLIIEKATSQITSVRVFFNSLSAIPALFSKFPQRVDALDNMACQVPKPSVARCNFKSRTVNAVNEMKDALIECCTTLEMSKSKDTGCTAAGIKRTLNDPKFGFWLNFFSKVMPYIDILFLQFQARNVDATKANASLEDFNSNIQKMQEECDDIAEMAPQYKKRKCLRGERTAAKEVCDVILFQCKERLSFINHLEASKLFFVKRFPSYAKSFPSYELSKTVEAYPMLEKDKLRTELSVLYAREDLCNAENLVDLLKVITDNHLQLIFSEIVKLIKILITTPMITTEAERCFSTLKRIETFLHINTMMNERLTALAMISIENQMITEIKDFNTKVIDDFTTSKSCHMDFLFK